MQSLIETQCSCWISPNTPKSMYRKEAHSVTNTCCLLTDQHLLLRMVPICFFEVFKNVFSLRAVKLTLGTVHSVGEQHHNWHMEQFHHPEVSPFAAALELPFPFLPIKATVWDSSEQKENDRRDLCSILKSEFKQKGEDWKQLGFLLPALWWGTTAPTT